MRSRDFTREREECHDAAFTSHDAKERLLIRIEEVSRFPASTTVSELGAK